jgi:hypothetical protein
MEEEDNMQSTKPKHTMAHQNKLLLTIMPLLLLAAHNFSLLASLKMEPLRRHFSLQDRLLEGTQTDQVILKLSLLPLARLSKWDK